MYTFGESPSENSAWISLWLVVWITHV